MKYLIERDDGGVSVMEVFGEVDVAAEVIKWEAASPWKAVNVEPLNGALPDRAFRGAWKRNGKGVVVDMPRAREVLRQRIRRARAPMLAALDVDYQRADEAEDREAKRRIAAEKQRLRDATAAPAIEAAETPDALKAVWPL